MSVDTVYQALDRPRDGYKVRLLVLVLVLEVRPGMLLPLTTQADEPWAAAPAFPHLVGSRGALGPVALT